MKIVVTCGSEQTAEKTLSAGLMVGSSNYAHWLGDYKRILVLDNGMLYSHSSWRTVKHRFNFEYVVTQAISSENDYKATYKPDIWRENNLVGEAQIVYLVANHNGLVAVPRDAPIAIRTDEFIDRTYIDFTTRDVWVYAPNTREMWNAFTELTFYKANVKGVIISDLSLLNYTGLRSDCITDITWNKKSDMLRFNNNLIALSSFWERISYVR